MSVVRLDVKNLQWRAELNHKTGLWVAACDALSQVAQADTWGELLVVINEITNVLLTDLLQDGELEAFLAEKGWYPNVTLPREVPPEGIKFDVPAEVVRQPLRA